MEGKSEEEVEGGGVGTDSADQGCQMKELPANKPKNLRYTFSTGEDFVCKSKNPQNWQYKALYLKT